MMYGSRFLRACANRQGSASATFSTDAQPLHQSLVATGINALVGEEHSSWKSGLTLQLHSRNFVPEEQGRTRATGASCSPACVASLPGPQHSGCRWDLPHPPEADQYHADLRGVGGGDIDAGGVRHRPGQRPLSRRHGLDCLAALHGGRQQQARDAAEATNEVGGGG
ncbi:hypothetical protein ZWY2020_025162 [Hordeum vulgare]|nr:hypothetical protein ZWY2020_025162 [Hordeum vulgare]